MKILVKNNKGTIQLNLKEKQAGLATLKKMRALFRDGAAWIQKDEKQYDEAKGFDTFCLVGAAHEADGKGEALARLAIASAITRNMRVDDAFGYHAIDELEEEKPISWGTDSISYYNFEDTITGYNDKETRRWRDIKGVLDRAEALIKGGVIKLKD